VSATCQKRLRRLQMIVRLHEEKQEVLAQIFYVAGVKRSRLEVSLLLGTVRSFPAVRSDGRFGENGMGHPHYLAALHSACFHSVHRAQRSSPPKEIVLLLAQEPEIDISELMAEAKKQTGEEHPPTDNPTTKER
jgi:hypothetical protein